METIGSKRSYALIWCMPNNDDDDQGDNQLTQVELESGH